MISQESVLPVQQIGIQALPNQALSVVLNNVLFEITLKLVSGITSATIIADGEILIQNTRVVANFPILPYPYLQDQGNFVITSVNDDYPFYEQFGITQFMYYVSPFVIETLNG